MPSFVPRRLLPVPPLLLLLVLLPLLLLFLVLPAVEAQTETPHVTSIDPSRGLTDETTPVVIEGTFLGSNASHVVSVTLAGVNCSDIVPRENTTIECVAGISNTAKNGPVIVTTIWGVSNDDVEFEYYRPPPHVSEIDPDNGPAEGGTSVVITGQNLGMSGVSVRSITLADEPCTDIEWVDSTTLRCVSGDVGEARQGPVIVETVDGTSNDDVQYTYNPAPVVESIYPSSGPANDEVSVTIEGSNFGSESNIVSVTIDDLNCSNVRLDGGGDIRCETGKRAETSSGPVIVQTVSGGSSAGNVIYTYYAPPSISSFDPQDGPADGGTLLKIKGQDLGSEGNELEGVWVVDTPCDFESFNSSYVECITAPSSGRGPITIRTTPGGQGKSTTLYTYNPKPFLNSVSPNNGPLEGGTRILIEGDELGEGVDDIESVLVNNVPCNDIEEFPDDGQKFYCVTGAAEEAGTGPVIVTFYSAGTTDGDVQYTYNPVPETVFVLPSEGPERGGTEVYIFGIGLGKNITDIVDVKIANISCKSTLVFHNESLVSCFTSPSGMQVTGQVVVETTSGGTGVAESNAWFTYIGAPVIEAVNPPTDAVTGFTTIHIFGSNLGRASFDVEDVLLANVSCLFSMTYYNSKHISCLSSASTVSLSGPVSVTTFSGGTSNSTTTFTYHAVCTMLQTEDECKAQQHLCSWCGKSGVCLSDGSSCIEACMAGSVSCGALILIFLNIGLAIFCIGGFFLIGYVINRDEDLVKDLRKMSIRYHPTNDTGSKNSDDDDDDSTDTGANEDAQDVVVDSDSIFDDEETAAFGSTPVRRHISVPRSSVGSGNGFDYHPGVRSSSRRYASSYRSISTNK